MGLRVCMLVTYDMASPGGVKHHAFQLAAALRAAGDEVTIVGPSSTPIDDPRVHTFGGVVNIPGNGGDNMVSLLASPIAVAQYFAKNRFDVVHVHEPLLPTLSYWTLWPTRHIPHVATFHAYSEAEAPAVRLARRVWGAAMFPWFQRGIAVSQPAAQHAAHAWRRPLALIPNGVDTATFTPPLNSGPPSPGAPIRLFFAGRLGDSRKGSRLLFDAYRGLMARHLPVTLDVAGELGGAPPPPALPGLRYHGALGFERLKDLAQLYQACDVLVAPATGQESFGMVLLEAMACGKPLICSDIAGYRSVARPEGAHFVPPGDAPALEEALVRFVQLDPKERLRQGEFNRRAAQPYDWSLIAARVRSEYLAAIAAR